MATFTIEGEEIITKTVGDGGDSGRIYVPIAWLGEDVKVVRLRKAGVKGIQGEKGEEGVNIG